MIEADPLVSVSRLAQTVNLSVSRLEHLFRRDTGDSLLTAIRSRRVERAATLLTTTEMRIKEVTYAVGYAHQSSFNRAFKHRFGLGPKAYRNGAAVAVKE